MFGISVSSKQKCEPGFRPGKILGWDQMHYQQTENVWSEIQSKIPRGGGVHYQNITKYLDVNYAATNLFSHAPGKIKGKFDLFSKEKSQYH